MSTLNGTDGYDVLTGGAGNDVINGKGGSDELVGGAGNDVLNGGEGDDSLTGGLGDDTLNGDAGNDWVYDRDGGKDVLNGGAGDDHIYITRLQAAPATTVKATGGDGADFISYQSFNNSAATLDGGAGADTFQLWANGGTATIVTGSGADTIDLDNFSPYWQGVTTVTDFKTGAGGDKLEWDGFLGKLENYIGGNPFASGHARLVQSGSNTILQIDTNGGGNSFVNLITFKGVSASSFVADNLGGFRPDGKSATGVTLNGTDGYDVLTGGAGNDVINGKGGSDELVGGAGNDVLNGGEGDDSLTGGLGDDTLNGDAGNDWVYDRDGGKDVLNGGAGDDHIYITRLQAAPATTVKATGGDGADFISYQSFNNSAATLDGGAGADTFQLWANGGTATIVTGSGADTIDLDNFSPYWQGVTTVTDFKTGAGGDKLEWDGFLGKLENYIGGNPFASGHARLVQSGSNTILQIDTNGGGNSFVNLITFKGVSASSFVADNLGGFRPDGKSATGVTLNGTDGYDVLTGGAGNDVINGKGGSDELVGGAGNDVLNGGEGDDSLTGGLGDDTLNGDAGNDWVYDRDGGKDVLNGGAGDDHIYITRLQAAPATTVKATGGDGADFISYQSFNNSAATLDGGAGADTFQLWANGGTATIVTGSGADTIDLDNFSPYWQGVTTVTDFKTGAGGDKLEWDGFLGKLENYIGGNPFASGHARLVQSGSNTILQIDTNGGGNSFVNLITFKGVSASSFVADNLGGFPVKKIAALAADAVHPTGSYDEVPSHHLPQHSTPWASAKQVADSVWFGDSKVSFDAATALHAEPSGGWESDYFLFV